MVAIWSTFARTGNPSNSAIPAWPRFDPKGRATMLLSHEGRAETNPDGARRQALARLPPFESSRSTSYPQPGAEQAFPVRNGAFEAAATFRSKAA